MKVLVLLMALVATVLMGCASAASSEHVVTKTEVAVQSQMNCELEDKEEFVADGERFCIMVVRASGNIPGDTYYVRIAPTNAHDAVTQMNLAAQEFRVRGLDPCDSVISYFLVAPAPESLWQNVPNKPSSCLVRQPLG